MHMPRREAVITVAQRVAEEVGVEAGQEVGHFVRIDDSSTPSTKIKCMTDGMLIREARVDSQVKRYSIIFLDEAHEHTVNTDVMMGLSKGSQKAKSQCIFFSKLNKVFLDTLSQKICF